MSKFKKIIIVFFVVVGVIATIIVTSILKLTSGMTEVGDGFFSSLKNSDYAKSETYLSEEFNTSTPRQELIKYLNKIGIDKVRGTSWSSRSVEGNTGYIRGDITTETNRTIPIILRFVKNGDEWKIYSIEKRPPGLVESEDEEKIPNNYLPSKNDQLSLVKETTSYLTQGLETKNLGHFYNYISKMWQTQIDIPKLQQILSKLLSANIKWTALNSMNPSVVYSNKLDSNDILIVSGEYNTNPNKVVFEYKYIFEGIAWKLFGFKFNLK